MAEMIDFNGPGLLENLEWSNKYNVGDDLIDNAHKKLFGVIRRVLFVLEEGDSARNRNVCREAVKFLEAYTLRHFAEEEAFQRSVNYSGYYMHKSLHDNLRGTTLPALKKQLEDQDYSPDSIEDFVSILVGWLTGHVMVEDQAITGKVSSRWTCETNDDVIDNLDKEMYELVKNVFHTDISMINRHYAGENINDGIFYRLYFEGKSDFRCSVTIFAEMPVIFLMSGGLLGRKVFQIERTALLSYLQLIQAMSINIVHILYPESDAVIKKSEKETAEGLREKFVNGYPDISLLWKTSEGCIGICIEKKTGE
ncbi:MAG: hemerythrin domain-containing protein [Selenomonadaceae bacterium]|nr:hemerythrin domain-containing protein [Selenomonadaceae bacterium]